MLEKDVRAVQQLVWEQKYNHVHGPGGEFGTSDSGAGGGAGAGAHPIVKGKKIPDSTLTNMDLFKQYQENGVEALRFKEAHGYEGLYQVVKQQGFDGKPQVVSDLSPYIAVGELQGLRGMKDPGGRYKGALLSGEYYAGHGIFGHGTYFATVATEIYGDMKTPEGDFPPEAYQAMKDEVAMFTRTDGSTTEATIKKEALIGDYSILKSEAAKRVAAYDQTVKDLQRMRASKVQIQRAQYLRDLHKDVGTFAVIRGYDGYTADQYSMEMQNGFPANHTVILNRTALRIKG